MLTYKAVVEWCPATCLYVGHVPGVPGFHSQGESLEELAANLREVLELLLEDDEPLLYGKQLVARPIRLLRPNRVGARIANDVLKQGAREVR